MGVRLFTLNRRDQVATAVAAAVGELRLIAKTQTGAGIVEPVPGFLYCNGVSLLRTDYARLFAEIGTTFGSADGTHFTLPDFRGRFMAGATDGQASSIKISSLVLGGVLGAESIALAKANLPTHTHNVGTLAIAASGSQGHTFSGASMSKNNQDSNDAAQWSTGTSDGTATATFDGGGLTAATHSHPSSEWSGSVEDGTVDGLVATAHQNVHSHQAIGGVLVAY